MIVKKPIYQFSANVIMINCTLFKVYEEVCSKCKPCDSPTGLTDWILPRRRSKNSLMTSYVIIYMSICCFHVPIPIIKMHIGCLIILPIIYTYYTDI